MTTRPLVSVMIPAYDRPAYTGRAVQSALEQEYRPLEVVVSDNGSPVSLEPVVTAFKRFEDDRWSVRYYRQPRNLGLGDNYTFLIDHLRGKYAVSLNNDDWFTDKRFLIEAVDSMENNPDCYLCVANSEIEKSNGMKMIKLPPGMDAKDGYRILEGDAYIKLLGYDGIGFQSYSAVVFNLAVARSLGVMRYPFNIPEWLAREVDIPSDEGFALQFLLSSVGSVALTEKVVSVRGMAEESYSRSERWQKLGNQAMFIIFYNLYQARLDGKYAQIVKQRAKETIFVYAVSSINFKILRHYKYKREVIFLMILSWVLYYTRYYVRMLQGINRVIVKRDSAEVKKILSKVRERGLLRSLFPFR